jgi:hypothetical protein
VKAAPRRAGSGAAGVASAVSAFFTADLVSWGS